MTSQIRVVFLSSGEGQLFEATAKTLIQANSRITVEALVTQNLEAGCVKRSKALGIPVFEIDTSSFENSLFSTLKNLKPDYIVLTGFTRLIPESVVKHFEGRICNSHPSLLPKYGGKGMYGRKVHEAVLAANETKTGITLHVVTPEYDKGPVIATLEVPVVTGESAESLEKRVKVLEREFLPKALLSWWNNSH